MNTNDSDILHSKQKNVIAEIQSIVDSIIENKITNSEMSINRDEVIMFVISSILSAFESHTGHSLHLDFQNKYENFYDLKKLKSLLKDQIAFFSKLHPTTLEELEKGVKEIISNINLYHFGDAS